MRLVIADTSPINYLLLIGHIDILPKLFERVIVPEIVRDELTHPKAPAVVRNWIASPPDWVEIRNAKAKFTIRRSNHSTPARKRPSPLRSKSTRICC